MVADAQLSCADAELSSGKPHGVRCGALLWEMPIAWLFKSEEAVTSRLIRVAFTCRLLRSSGGDEGSVAFSPPVFNPSMAASFARGSWILGRFRCQMRQGIERSPCHVTSGYNDGGWDIDDLFGVQVWLN